MVRACAVEMHVEISQESLCQEIYRENAGAQMEHPDQTPAFTLTVKTLSVGTLFGEFLLRQTPCPISVGQIAIISGSTHKFVALIPNIYCYFAWLNLHLAALSPISVGYLTILSMPKLPQSMAMENLRQNWGRRNPEEPVWHSWELGRKVWG